MTSEGYFLNCMDPGGDTGLSLLHIQPDSFRLIDYATVPWRPESDDNPTATLIGWRLDYPGVHHLLYESFHLRNTPEAAGADLTALEVIGAVKQMLFDRGRMYEKIYTQEPVEAKHMATDEKLEKLGLEMGTSHGQRHVRDANRHAVTHLANRGYLPVCRAAFPRGAGRSRALRPAPVAT